jgi:hypothetical protein
MGSFGVAMVPPSFDDDLGFTQRVEDLAVQQLVHCPAGACKAICQEGRIRPLKLSQ